MSSGVMVDPDVQTSFQKLSEGRKEYRYIIFKIDENKVIVEAAVTQDQLGITGDDYDDSSKAAFDKFVEDVKSRTDNLTDCRYAVFDFKFTCSRVGAGTSKMDKIIFLQISALGYEGAMLMMQEVSGQCTTDTVFGCAKGTDNARQNATFTCDGSTGNWIYDFTGKQIVGIVQGSWN